jgi:hypothetical protein
MFKASIEDWRTEGTEEEQEVPIIVALVVEEVQNSKCRQSNSYVPSFSG